MKKSQKTLGLSLGGALLTGAALGLALLLGRSSRRVRDGHAAPDLEGDTHRAATDRAPDAFRPDPTAPVPASERDALRPATL